MFIYEKLVADKRKLFAAEGNVPSEADVEVAYKTADGIALELTRDRFVYQRDGKLFVAAEGAHIPGDADTEIGVFAGDKQLIGVVEIKKVEPDPEEPVVTPTEPEQKETEEPSTQTARKSRKATVVEEAAE